MWQYNLSGSFENVVVQFIGDPTILTIVDKYDINRDAAVPESVYQGRIEENINATEAEITIFALQRSESGGYEIELLNSNRQRARNRVTVQVQCKLSTSSCKNWISIFRCLVRLSEVPYRPQLSYLSYFLFVFFVLIFNCWLETWLATTLK